ncbi:MAG: cell surface protein SprA [Muribaculaceae bacterium]|nr:cell surface protein SprA [Muribaculaceae bacterium]
MTAVQPSQPQTAAQQRRAAALDTLNVEFDVHPTIPAGYDDVQGNGEYSIDLKDPSNIKTEAEYDPENGCYIIRTKLGDNDIVTPFIISASEYNNLAMRQSMMEYYRKKNAESAEEKAKNPFNFLDMQFGLGPLESIFGPGGVQLKTQGSVKINMGVKSNKTDNPALSVSQRRKTYFDFDNKIQATVSASVGDKMKFNMTYNTDATFDFDNKNLKLAYEGKEDEIIKNIEAGNVSMTTGSELIRGSAALFGIKTKLQFGKLTATALVSQQNSETQTVNTRGGSQTTPFYITADKYDQNRNFFLSHFFRDNYDNWCSHLPLVSSGVNITRVEVWITNKRGTYNESRNIMAFMDAGESVHMLNDHWQPNAEMLNPSNESNTLMEEIKTQYPDARYMALSSTALQPLQAFGFEGGRDYEKIESARLLNSSEYTLSSALGYIQLKTALNPDEVLAVAFQYTYGGKTYQVGEFASDVPSTEQSIYLKMIKGTTTSPAYPCWDLMMKNIYSIGGYQMSRQNFKLNIKYLSDTTGTELTYIPDGAINGKPLLQVMNLDRLDANNETNIDGRFDYIEGYTVNSSLGKIIFPVVEPFGSHLRQAFGNDALADRYVYEELYDSTLTIARQAQDKNKFVLTGEYQGSGGGNVIRLNAMNVPRGSVVVTAGGVPLTENSDYTVDYNMGTVTITNQSIIDAGTNISVSMENQSNFSMQRKTLLGLDLNYAFNKNFHIGGTVMHYGEKSLTEKVAIGDELVNNTIWGVNMAYKTKFMWLTNLLNKIPTVNATAPSEITFKGEFAQLLPHQAKTGSNRGSSYIDDFESTQSGIDLRSPYSWFLASTPYDGGSGTLFEEAGRTDDVSYGSNRSLLAWYYIDRLFTQRNSSYVPGYIKNDLDQLSNPYVREVPYSEVFPGRELNYGESSTVQTLNLSFYPKERGPYNLDAENVDADGYLLNPEKRWGGIMRKLDNTDFEQSNIEYIQFWLLDPFLDDSNPNRDGGSLYFNLGEVSEDILKDGLKSYENGLGSNVDQQYIKSTNWGKVSTQTSLTYAFDTSNGDRKSQDVGLNGLSTDEEKTFPTYRDFVTKLRTKLSPEAISRMEQDQFSPLNDPASDNYHFFRGYDYDELRLGILERYKHYNGTEGNSISVEDASDGLYQSARSVPDVEDINQDNTLNEYERYFQYRVAIHPDSLQVGRNHIIDKRESVITTRNGERQNATWYQFSIPLRSYEKKVGSINDFTTIRFVRMFLTGFTETTHLRFATLELMRGEWRNYDYNLNMRGDAPAQGSVNVNTVNIEENASREPVNYVLPPGVSRIVDSGQSQITQLNEQSMQMKVEGLQPGDARGVYRNTQLDLRIYQRLQMFLHAEAFIDDAVLRNGDVSAFLRLGSDIKNNYYEYEIPLDLTAPGRYSTNSSADRLKVWPEQNMLDIDLDVLTNVKKERNAAKLAGESGVGYNQRFTRQDPNAPNHRVTVQGNPSLGDVRVMMIGVRNNANSQRNCVVWADELRVTDFDNEGGWAAKASMTLNMSDIATVNAAFHKETHGFGAVNQSLSQRRLDDYDQYSIAVQGDAGRFLPEKVKLKAPIYYSYNSEKTTPKYNPLDQDILLKDAIDACSTDAQRDSINNFALTQRTASSFSLSNLKFDVKSKNPMPWDPANFTFSYSFNRQHLNDPDNVYENTSDTRGSFQYSWTPYAKPFTPFKSLIDAKNKNMKFFREWEIHWLPSNIAFSTNISRYYYEQQTRNETGIDVELPVSVSKNFLWDRQFSISWSPLKSLTASFNSNTTAHILEPVGQVNKRLFPDQYRDWRDSVWRSIKDLGTPWKYNQTFNASYKAPFNAIPILSFLTASATYNATYNWDRGTQVAGVTSGNTIANQSSLSFDTRLAMDQLYNKVPYLKDVNKRFSGSGGDNKRDPKKPKAKKFNRTFKLNPDSSTIIKHNMNVKEVRVTATTTKNKPFPVEFKKVDDNTVEILTHGEENIKFTITEVQKEHGGFLWELGQYTTRLLMSVRSVNVRFRTTRQLNLPQFVPEIGDIFGQSTHYDVMSPGLDFAFGFVGESYIERAKQHGWLLGDQTQTSPALFARTQEFNAEVQLEPIKGLKITLTGNRTDNRTSQVQFMYDDMTALYSGSYTKTHVALRTALRGVSADNGYQSKAWDDFLANIPIVADRIQQQYAGTTYPDRGFLQGSIMAGKEFNPESGTVNPMSSDVLIPAFMAAYSGKSPHKVTLNPFPALKEILPNWRVTYDGLSKMELFKKWFKSFTLTHAYQCTYQVGSFNSFTDWVAIGDGLGFTKDAITGNAIPSSPYNISSVTVTEKFAPLIGVNVTLKNEMTFNCEFRDSRTLTLNSSAGQLVEALTRSFVLGAGYKIANFGAFLKLKGQQKGVSNDLTMNLNVQLNNNTGLIRKMDVNTTQATNGTRTLGINFTANYQMSKRVTLGAYFDHQVNTPLVSATAYPTTNSNYGISINLSLTK